MPDVDDFQALLAYLNRGIACGPLDSLGARMTECVALTQILQRLHPAMTVVLHYQPQGPGLLLMATAREEKRP